MKKSARKATDKPKDAPKKARPRGLLRGAFGFLAKWGLVAGIWGSVAAAALIVVYAYDLPNVDEAFAPTRRPTVTVLAVDGSEIAAVGDLYGMPARLADLPPALPHAVIATEDRRFYDHLGLDPIGLARALVANLRAGRVVQGGSTITQQVAKNLFLSSERSIKRKVQELLLALWLERRFTKDQILTVYLNRVYLGAGTYGVEAAAKRYFNRPVRTLSTWESAMIAGLLKAPSRYNPFADPKRADERTAQVLENMVAAGYLTPDQAKKAAVRKRGVVASRPGNQIRHFVDWVMEQAPGFVSPDDRDLIVHTTLDKRMQHQAEAAIARVLDGLGRKKDVGEAALVALTPDGAVRAMVGGRDYRQSQFNRATQALRQPGSAFKPFVYLAGLERGIGPDARFKDAPFSIDGWSPKNFKPGYQGDVTVAEALAQSINTVAVLVARTAGERRVVETAKHLGLRGDFMPTPALALGAGEVSLLALTAAYGPFANGGMGVWPYGIEKITDNRGRVLYARTGSGPGRVIAPDTAATMTRMLVRVIEDGTGHAAAIDRPAAGKTGTSQNHRDAWFIGFTADLVAGVWMGNDDGKPMRGVTGGGLPASAWKDFMAAAHKGRPAKPLKGAEPPAPSFPINVFGTLFGGAG